MQGISYDRRGLELVDGAEHVVFDLTPEGVHRGKLLAGAAPLPKGAEILGCVGGDGRDGALLRLANGVYVDYGAGVLRSLDQRAVVRAVETPRERMPEGTFRHLMGACRALCEGDYRRGYEYGLRRHYHGERFGDTAILEKMLAQGGDLAGGCGDGLSGHEPRDMDGNTSSRPDTVQPCEKGGS